jgi:undecaprenyl-diphosphatase
MILGMLGRGVKSRGAAIQALIAFPMANGITDLFKHNLPEERPCSVLADWVNHGVGCAESMGTASAHSANMAAVAFVFTYRMGWWGVPWVAVAFLTGFSRVYCGVHYPHQVVLGWIVGVAAGFFVTRVWDFIDAKRSPVLQEEGPETGSPST